MGGVKPEARAGVFLESDCGTFIPSRFPDGANRLFNACRPSRTLSKTHGDGELIEPRRFRRPLMRDRATRGLSDQTCIFGKRACPMSRRPRLPGLPAFRKLALANKEV